jgi:3-phosphoshikimate 1-carboxyvinyltransferase
VEDRSPAVTVETYRVRPVSGPLQATIRPPGSKSITNRALICAALAEGHSQLFGALDSEDTRVMLELWQQLGLSVSALPDRLEIAGCGGQVPRRQAALHCGNSGTTMRFAAAALAATGGQYVLDGVARMRQRPIADLVAALQQLGASVSAPSGCPPVSINGDGWTGGVAQVGGGISSQFLSGLLMAAPLAKKPVRLEVLGDLVSKPYVTMTLQVMRAFGAEVDTSPQLDRFEIAPQRYCGRPFTIEPDASAASYFWGAAAIVGGQVTVEGLGMNALQGDVGFCQCLKSMGCEVREQTGDVHAITVRGGAPLRGVDVDMNAISDTVQTLAAVALFANSPTTIRGVAHIRHKETDRIGDLAVELRKCGAAVEELADGLKITPPQGVRPATFSTYDDHRMAMSLALIGLAVPGVEIREPQCTSKTYPQFFGDLERVTQVT